MQKFNRLKNNIWLDCDGVLADFDYSADRVLGMPSRDYEKKHGSDKFWAALAAAPDFFLNLPLMPAAVPLYNTIKHMHPIILTGSPSQMGEIARVQKFKWVDKHFGKNQRVVVCQAKLKSMYCTPGDIIIDDWPKHRAAWESAGGIWIHHETATKTLEELIKLNAI